MDGSTVGDYSIILPDTLIPPGKKFDRFSLISGSPAKLIKILILITIINSIDLKSKSNFRFNRIFKKINLNFQSIKLEEDNTFIAPDALIGCNIFQNLIQVYGFHSTSQSR